LRERKRKLSQNVSTAQMPYGSQRTFCIHYCGYLIVLSREGFELPANLRNGSVPQADLLTFPLK
jgi:hypothetical protein